MAMMSTEALRTWATRFKEQVWNRGNLDDLDEFVVEDYVDHNPANPTHGREAYKQYIAAMRAAFPDLHFHLDDIIVQGDKVVERWTAEGTHMGPFGGIPPTGQRARISGITIFRLEGSQAAEEWGVSDRLGLLQQLGIVPAAG